MGKMAGEHDVVGRHGEAWFPDRRVIVGSQRIGLLHINVDESTPNFGRLPSPRLARMNHPIGAHPELLDRLTSHPGNVVKTVSGERPLRVLVLWLGPPMLHEVELH